METWTAPLSADSNGNPQPGSGHAGCTLSQGHTGSSVYTASPPSGTPYCKPARGRKPYSPFRMACSRCCRNSYLMASPWGCVAWHSALTFSAHLVIASLLNTWRLPSGCLWIPSPQPVQGLGWAGLHPLDTASVSVVVSEDCWPRGHFCCLGGHPDLDL